MAGFNEEKLSAVSEFIRNDLDHCFADSNGESLQLTTADRVHFYGPSYAARASSFKFTNGHSDLIRQMSAFIDRKINEAGIKIDHTGKNSRQNSAKTYKNVCHIDAGTFFANSSLYKRHQAKIRSANPPNGQFVKSTLTERARSLLTFISLHDKFEFSEDMVLPLITHSGISANLQCGVCMKWSTIQFFENKIKNKRFWVLSNYKKHMLRHVNNANKDGKFVDEAGAVDEPPSHITSLEINIDYNRMIEDLYQEISEQTLIMIQATLNAKEKTDWTLSVSIGQNKPDTINIYRIAGDGNC